MKTKPVAWALIETTQRFFVRSASKHGERKTKLWRPVLKVTPKRVFMPYPGIIDRTTGIPVKRPDALSGYRFRLIELSMGETKP